MCCLFCDQTPESVAAREKIAKIAKILECHPENVVMAVSGMNAELDHLRSRMGDTVNEVRRWMQHARELERMLADQRNLPAHYTREMVWKWNWTDDEKTKIAKIDLDIEAFNGLGKSKVKP